MKNQIINFLSALVVLSTTFVFAACDGGYDTTQFQQEQSADVVETLDTVTRVNTNSPKAEAALGHMTEYEHDPRRNLPVPFKEEAEPWTPVPVDHKSACGEKQECSDASDCPAPTDSCEATGCSLSGCCVIAPIAWNCCHTDDECGWGEQCQDERCTPVACPPPNVPPECIAQAFRTGHVCYVQYWPSADCTALRPDECHDDQGCWPDSECREGHCQQLSCLAQLDEGCYDATQAVFAADWKCNASLMPDGTICDDGDPATTTDHCVVGKCRGVGLASQDSP